MNWSWIIPGLIAAGGVSGALAVAAFRRLRDWHRYDRQYRGWGP